MKLRSSIDVGDIQNEIATANRDGREVKLSKKQLDELGHGKRPLTRVIRLFCLECMGGNAAEVRRCTSPGCALFPYRMGKNPFTGRKGRTGFAQTAVRKRSQPERGQNGEGPVSK